MVKQLSKFTFISCYLLFSLLLFITVYYSKIENVRTPGEGSACSMVDQNEIILSDTTLFSSKIPKDTRKYNCDA
jgi:hypothetical protein